MLGYPASSSVAYELGFDHLLFRCSPTDFAILRRELIEELIVLVSRSRDDPFAFSHAGVDAFDAAHFERRRLLIREDRAHVTTGRVRRRRLRLQLHVGVFLLRYHIHQFRYVFGEHLIDTFEQLLIQRFEFRKILKRTHANATTPRRQQSLADHIA